MLCAKRRNNKYQFYRLWFDPIRAQTTIYHTRSGLKHNDLPHSIRAQTQWSTTLDQGSNTMIYHTWGKHANRYTNDAVVINRKLEAHMSMYHSSDKKDFMNHCRSQLMLNLIPNSWTQQTMGQLLVQNVISISQCSLVQNAFLCLILQMILLLIFPTAANIKLLGP
jgi:hypothetical protein